MQHFQNPTFTRQGPCNIEKCCFRSQFATLFSDVSLLDGYLITGSTDSTETDAPSVRGQDGDRDTRKKARRSVSTYVWTAREVEDSLKEGMLLKRALIKSLKKRVDQYVSPAVRSLKDSVDLHTIVSQLSGTLQGQATPYNEISLFQHGLKDFELLVQYLSDHHCVRNSPQLVNNFHPVLASKIFSNVKEAIASTVWGNNFHKVGATMFEIVEGPEKGHVLSKLSGDAYVEEFSVVDS